MCLHINENGKYPLYVYLYEKTGQDEARLSIKGYIKSVAVGLTDEVAGKEALKTLHDNSNFYTMLTPDNTEPDVRRYLDGKLTN